MIVQFLPLQTAHFPLLLKWLQSEHIKKWWDPEVVWTQDAIAEKYESYVKGYKLHHGMQKKIQCFIITLKNNPIGYIQVYNAYDFSRTLPLENLPKSLAAFDIFIGEGAYLNQGIGSLALKTFVEVYLSGLYEYIFADPETTNIAAIKAYEKAGFIKIMEHQEINEIWMLRKV